MPFPKFQDNPLTNRESSHPGGKDTGPQGSQSAREPHEPAIAPKAVLSRKGSSRPRRFEDPWQELFSRAAKILRKADELKTPFLSIEIDGGVARRWVLPGLKEPKGNAPRSRQEWLLEELTKVAQDYPKPEKGIEVYAFATLVTFVRA